MYQPTPTRSVVLWGLLLSLAVILGHLSAPAGWTQANPPSAETQLVNINKANVQELTSLPGIGPKIAQRIVEYRTQHGPFKRKEELLNVQGIGPKKFERLKDRITL
ncbi:MAG: helix-hairpin-helix domain-containing protein [Acidobacteria bacterium]|nr:helix-hairpin-helix domain-containing protein [Acidobacteriota bacterium]MDW7984542.1 helix-hairpin-helix domain-containing protein [Acidobacteriota bacterium]